MTKEWNETPHSWPLNDPQRHERALARRDTRNRVFRAALLILGMIELVAFILLAVYLQPR